MSRGNISVPDQVSAPVLDRICATGPLPEGPLAEEPLNRGVCAVTEVLDRVGSKWSILIIVSAAAGPIRFTELERRIEGISRRMLTLTLRNLERDGLISRTVYPTAPPKVEYALTPVGLELNAYLASLTDWAERSRGAIHAARLAYDQARAAG
ncbi:winged helix-turn-helix transcriptional regulator [Kitasatospora kifunensis]|uniref:DNA-binding HxlR family transcriptional regulator n=1 Tax=Kitasatospora kifunensis TaxID=58351 RepID=A0A7W7QZR6_KITKI|nr:helix-turn-helix domain-containing protein [Kitasatospora kifunensis]MBB4922817.1 DNA-binding HxlR family transcriptional regulator [Kitasatospora kifunensis]